MIQDITPGSVIRDMTLRDWFAGAALTGILAAHAEEGMEFPTAERAAAMAFDYAAGMLVEREKRKWGAA